MSHVSQLTRSVLPIIYPTRPLTPMQGLANIIKSVASSAILSVASLALLPEPAGIIVAGILGATAVVTVIRSIFMIRVQGRHLGEGFYGNYRRREREPSVCRYPRRAPSDALASAAPRSTTRAVDRSAEHTLPPAPLALRAVDRSAGQILVPPPPPPPAPAAQRPVASRDAATAGASLANALQARRPLRAPALQPQAQRAQQRVESGPPSAASVAATRGALRPAASRARPAAAASANPIAEVRNTLRPAARRDADASRAKAR
jgi:hypothetical protein